MCKHFSFIFVLLFSIIDVFSQKFLYEYHFIEDYSTIENDSTVIKFNNSIPGFKLITFLRTEEYFVISDTLQRDYILLNEQKYLIDSLCSKQYNDYARSFEYNGTYIIPYRESDYLIVTGSNRFQMGTDTQPIYLIFQKKENKYQFLSSYYIENIDYYDEKILNSVRIIYRKNRIILKGINLICVHGCH
jgi:hypothetical protein